MDERVEKWLVDSLGAANAITQFTSGQTYEDYCETHLLRSAVERQFEILGEALRRIRDQEEDIFDSITGASQAVGFRNILAHNYDSIDNRIVWSIIETHLGSLVEDLVGLTTESKE